MKEVKRVFAAGFTELPGCGDRCWSSAIDVDQWGARIEVYGMTSAEATELRDEVLSAIFKLAAETLRADTAEAELDALRYKAELYDEVWADATGRGYANVTMALCALTAAEQRIAQTVAKLELAASMLDDDERGNRFAQVLQLAIVALNPKPEAGSHE